MGPLSLVLEALMDVDGLYSIKDTLAEEFGPIFQAPNDGIAWRNVSKFLLKVSNQDRGFYELYNLGKFNRMTGEVLQESTGIYLISKPDWDDIDYVGG